MYLARLSTNQAGEEATHFIKHVVAGWTGVRSVPAAPYSHALDEALGFFGSKVINHKRKATHGRAFYRVLARVRAGQIPEEHPEAVVAGMVITHKRWERGAACAGFASWFDQDPVVLRRSLQALGYMLGERLYYALVRGTVTKAEVRELFEQPFASESEAAATYFHWVNRLRKIPIPSRI